MFKLNLGKKVIAVVLPGNIKSGQNVFKLEIPKTLNCWLQNY